MGYRESIREDIVGRALLDRINLESRIKMHQCFVVDGPVSQTLLSSFLHLGIF